MAERYIPKKPSEKPRRGGRRPGAGGKTTYKPEYDKQAYRLCLLLNATDAEVAKFFEVSEPTLYAWKRQFPTFAAAMREGKAPADAAQALKLFQRGQGYSHPEEKILVVEGQIVRVKTTKHYPPDTTALIFWLKNRRPDLWRDRHEVTGKDGDPLFDFSKLTENDLTDLEAIVGKAVPAQPTANTGANPAGKGKTVH